MSEKARRRNRSSLRPKTMQIAYNAEERARWDSDAAFLGFGHCGAHYVRFVLNSRADGRLILMDKAFERVIEVFAHTFGIAIGEVRAAMEKTYLEGK